MAEPEKPFICYKSGLGMKIVPRNSAGVVAIGIWLLSLLPILAGFIWILSRLNSGRQALAYSIGFTLAMIVWSIAMIVWTKNRSEMVDMEELLRLKRELDAQKRRGRR